MTIIKQIKAEIEKRIELHDSLASNAESEMIANLEIGAAQALDDLRSFLSTLEPEKQTNLEERIGSYNIAPYIDDKIAKLQDMWREEKVSFDWDDLKDMIEDVARHFAQWGAEHLADARKTSPKDLEEAAWAFFDTLEGKEAWSYGPSHYDCDDVNNAFIAGAKWDRDQMMNEAVGVQVVGEQRDLRLIDSTQRCLFNAKRGDWLEIIICKKEDGR